MEQQLTAAWDVVCPVAYLCGVPWHDSRAEALALGQESCDWLQSVVYILCSAATTNHTPAHNQEGRLHYCSFTATWHISTVLYRCL